MKRVLLAIFDPPWLVIILGWPVLVMLAMIHAWPENMNDIIDSASTPEMQLAILREIKGAERRVVLEFASGVLTRVARVVPDPEGRAGIARAQEKMRQRIEQSAQSSSAVDKEDSGEPPPATDDKKNADAQSAAPPVTSAEQRALTRAEKRAKERKRDHPEFDIDFKDNGDMHVDLGFVDRSLAKELEAKYGKSTLPALEPELKRQVYERLQDQVRHLVSGVLTIILLVLALPLFIMSKVVMSVIRAFSNRAERSEKIAQQNSLARQLTEAKLAALQAQVEPHFLFNTMASVQQLIETDPATAAKMQADLIRYLRGAVPQMRESTSTLAREIELSTAYLDILKIRMEDRLTYAIDVPTVLMGARFPPMMLPTLIENAIKHGLEPLTAGGAIRITAREANGKLLVTVADTGMGFAHEPGKGVGLTNVRERLAATYGKAAQLVVEPNQPRGAKLTIEIPLPRPKAP